MRVARPGASPSSSRTCTADLTRTLGLGWRFDVTDGLVLAVTGPVGQKSSALCAEVEDEAWYGRHDFVPAMQAEALDADAQEAV